MEIKDDKSQQAAPGSVRVGFVVDKVALGQGFPRSYLGFPC
jgi:hypothetical protein